MSHRWITLASIAFYLSFLLGVGIWTRRRTADFRDYVTGGGIPAWMLALSFVANYISSNSKRWAEPLKLLMRSTYASHL